MYLNKVIKINNNNLYLTESMYCQNPIIILFVKFLKEHCSSLRL